MNYIIQFSIHHQRRKIWNWFRNDVIKKWLCIENFRKFQNYFSCSSLLTLCPSSANHLISHLPAENSSIIRKLIITARSYEVQHYYYTTQHTIFFTSFQCSCHFLLSIIRHRWGWCPPDISVLARTVAVIMRETPELEPEPELAPPSPAWSPSDRGRRPGSGARTMVRWYHKIE